MLDSFLAGYELRRELRFGTSIISAIFPQIVGPERARVPKASRRRHLRSYGEPHRRHDDAWVSQRDWIVFWRFLKKYDAGRAWQSLRILDRVPDKGEVGGSSPPRPTIKSSIDTRRFSLFPFLGPAPKKQFAKNLPKIRDVMRALGHGVYRVTFRDSGQFGPSIHLSITHQYDTFILAAVC